MRGHIGSMEDNRSTSGTGTPNSPSKRNLVENSHRQLVSEMRAQNFDTIRFATYRTACKLRFIQRKTNLYLVDIWNVIEAFRDSGFNSMDHTTEVPINRLEQLLSNIFIQLNKRLPSNSHINAQQSTSLLQSFIMSAYDSDNKGRIKVFSIKVGLSTICSGKQADILRYIFTQISDTNGILLIPKFKDYLKEVLALPTAVYEGPSFSYTEAAAKAIFDGSKSINVNDFIEALLAEPAPQCLMWLSILHRMGQIENVLHPVQCEGCGRESFLGFRYKCQRCFDYHLCQECFWRGKTSGNHNNDHEMKEYSSYKSPVKELSNSLKKSFRCVPAKHNNNIPRFPETPEKTLNLTHIVPPTPPPVHNGFNERNLSHRSLDVSSMDSCSATKSLSRHRSSVDNCSTATSKMDDEHRLIARYAARLAADCNNANTTVNSSRTSNEARSPTEINYKIDANKQQRELIMQLESKNREIMREIQRLRQEQEAQTKIASETRNHTSNPTLIAELRLLRQRRDELEGRMSSLQESRRELMVQLEGLMKLLKVDRGHSSPRSTPNSSPRGRNPNSPPITLTRANSLPANPGDSLAGVGGDIRQAFGGNSSATSSVRSLRNDLLVAADSVTNAMSFLVKELNSGASSGSEDEDDDIHNHNHNRSKKGQEIDEVAMWQQEMQQRLAQDSEFLRELRARKDKHRRNHSHGYISSQEDGLLRSDEYNLPTTDTDSYIKTDEESTHRTDEEDAELYDRPPKELITHRYTTDEESCLETDQESYIRTDDEEGGNTDWEENMRRWVNR